MALAIILVIAAIVIGVVIRLKAIKEKQENIDKGITMQRQQSFFDTPFYRKEHTYTMNGDWDTVWGALQKADYHGSISEGKKESGVCAVNYTAKYFTARFSKMKTEPGEKFVYKFIFTYWKANRGVPYSEEAMNALLTTIEKTLLQIDPGTQVSTERYNHSTKTNIL